MKKTKLEKTLKKTLDDLSSEKLQPGQYKKVGKKYLVRLRSGSFTSADSLEEAVQKGKA